MSVRFFTQWLCTAATMLVYREKPVFERKEWQAMLARCVFGILSMVLFCALGAAALPASCGACAAGVG